MTTTTTQTALYNKPGGKGRWVQFGLYPTREQAFRAVDDLPDRHPVLRLEEVLAQTSPTAQEAARVGYLT